MVLLLLLLRSVEHHADRLARSDQDPGGGSTGRHRGANPRYDLYLHLERDLPDPGRHAGQRRFGHFGRSHAGQIRRSRWYTTAPQSDQHALPPLFFLAT